MNYFLSYSHDIQNHINQMIDNKLLEKYLLSKYNNSHQFNSDKSLRNYVMTLKNQYLKKSAPISKVCFDDKLHVVKNALGTHTFISRIQGSKLKSKNEIRISAMFKKVPEEFLEMIVVHELAHVKEKDHNKAFYKLCQHMMPNYHQLELDVRIYMAQLELFGEIYH